MKEQVNFILANLPLDLTKEGTNRELFQVTKEGVMNPMTVFLLHEMERFNQLLKFIRVQLNELNQVLDG